ncbi:MAG TPA: peptidoglycan DD-metalloendopeptidase family protein [Chthoniobacter sp.]|nr:peptidoglycan DD-metalloendopeptidase family protein [Chthoniobacter sp.]
MRLSVLCAIVFLVSALPLCAQDTATVRAADAFEYPVGPNGTGDGYYIARGYRPNGHLGEDWNGVRGGNTDLGDPVYATANGYVTYANNYHVGWGNVVILRHAYYEGSTLKYVDSLYGHLLEFFVHEGEQVKRGQKIGRIGNNFGMYEAHLHFEMRKNLQIGMFRSSFARDFSNYFTPNEFVAAHRVCPNGNRMVSIPINTYPPVAPPVLAGPHLESPMSGPPSAGGSPHFIRIAPLPTSAPVVQVVPAATPAPTPTPKPVVKIAAPTPAPATPEPKIAKAPTPVATPTPTPIAKSTKTESSTTATTAASAAKHSKSTASAPTPTPTPVAKSSKKTSTKSEVAAASPTPTPSVKGSKTSTTASAKKGEKLPTPVAATTATPAPSSVTASKTHKAPAATPTPQPTVATRVEPETITSDPLFPTPTGAAPGTNSTPIRRSAPGYKVDRFEDLRGKPGY